MGKTKHNPGKNRWKRKRSQGEWQEPAGNKPVNKPKYQKPPSNKKRGLKPDYTPNGAVQARNPMATYITDIDQLTNGVFDRDEYFFQNAFFKKVTVSVYKEAEDLCLAIEFSGAVEGHALLLSGVEPGTRIFASTLAKREFKCGIKDPQILRAIEALYKYLRDLMEERETLRKTETIVSLTTAPDPVKEPLSTDLKLIWEGKEGFVEHNGIRFRVSTEEVNGHPFRAVRVDFAPKNGTELSDLSGADTYIAVSKLHRPEFVSPLPEGSKGRETQERIWNFLRGEFAKAGITGGEAKVKPVSVAASVVPQPKPVAKKPQDSYKGSSDLGQLASGFYGYYAHGKPGARVLIRVRSHVSKTNGRERSVVELIRCEKGNSLHGKCELGTHIPHVWLERELDQMDEIRGARAPDMTMLHVYLTGAIDAHQKEVYASMGARVKVKVAPSGNGERVNPPQVGLISAEPPMEGEHIH